MAAKKLSVLWTKHIKDQSKRSDFESTIRNSTTALGRLKEILLEFEKELEVKEQNFDEPNWPYRQAHLVGQKHAFHKIKQLLENF